ncbi:MAG: MFS transporter [Anaerolineae bacterium]
MVDSPQKETVETYGKWVLAAAIFAASMAFIDVSALHVALPTIQKDLGATGAQLLWIINSYALMLASLLLVSGALGDRYGHKRIFSTGIGVFAVASLACGFAPTARILIAMRTVQGVGAAIMVPGGLSLIISHFPANDQGRAIGIWSAASALVTVAGPLLGGLLADAGLWRYLFFINIPLGLLGIFALTKVPETQRLASDKPIDIFGAILATVGLAGITYSFLAVPELESGFAHPQAWGTLALGCGSFVGFVYWQLLSVNPMVPLNLFRSRIFSATNVVTFLLYAAMSVFSFFLSLNLVQIQGYEAREAGFAFLPFALLVVILSPWAGKYSDKNGPRLLLTLGPISAGIGILWISFIGLTSGISEMWTTFFPGMILFGVGISMTVAPLTTAVMTALPNQYAGVASGVNNAVSRTAGVLATAIMGGLAIVLFQQYLGQYILTLPLSAAEQLALLRNATQLAETQVPETVSAAQALEIQHMIKLAFIDMNRVTMRICATLAITSGLISWLYLDSTSSIQRTRDASRPPSMPH